MSSPLVDSAVEAMEKYTGVERGYRRAHARGLVCAARFTATPALRSLTTAEHFQGAAIPALVRLSNASGSPHAPDRMSPTVGKVLGLAVRFQLPSGAVASWAAANCRRSWPARPRISYGLRARKSRRCSVSPIR